MKQSIKLPVDVTKPYSLLCIKIHLHYPDSKIQIFIESDNMPAHCNSMNLCYPYQIQ